MSTLHKSKLFIVFGVLFATTVYAQWLETTIYIPDSLSGVIRPQAFTYNPTNNKIYVGGEYGNCVIVIDGPTNQKIAKIPAGSNISYLCYNPTNNKVYCANYVGNSVTVIDVATNFVIITIPVGDYPCAFAYNPVQNRTYVANYYGSSISVIRDVTGIEEVFMLETLGISPNPFYLSTKIKYSLAKQCNVSLKIYNVAGQCVRTLVNTSQDAGIYEITWNGEDDNRTNLPQGIYLLRMEAGDYTAISKIIKSN